MHERRTTKTIWAGIAAAFLAVSPAMAQSRFLFLAEDVPPGSTMTALVSTNTSQTSLSISEPLFLLPVRPGE
jgi:hypothetical protein